VGAAALDGPPVGFLVLAPHLRDLAALRAGAGRGDPDFAAGQDIPAIMADCAQIRNRKLAGQGFRGTFAGAGVAVDGDCGLKHLLAPWWAAPSAGELK
jgi:hypothetical protein